MKDNKQKIKAKLVGKKYNADTSLAKISLLLKDYFVNVGKEQPEMEEHYQTLCELIIDIEDILAKTNINHRIEIAEFLAKEFKDREEKQNNLCQGCGYEKSECVCSKNIEER
jgi:hypothetical protein